MDEVDVELARLALWALFAAGTLAYTADAEDAVSCADAVLEAATERFPFLAPPAPPDPTGGLIA